MVKRVPLGAAGAGHTSSAAGAGPASSAAGARNTSSAAKAASTAGARRSQVFDQALKALRTGGKGLQGAAVGGLRVLMPLVESYIGGPIVFEEGGEVEGVSGLKVREEAVLKAGTQKAFLELVEIASITHPVYPDAPRFMAYNSDGMAQTPRLVHLLALVAAAQQYFRDDDGDDDQCDGDGDGEPEPIVIPPGQSVVFMSVAPGEYAMRSGPMTASEIRRMSMRQRSYNPPQAARLISAPNAREVVVGPAQGSYAMRSMSGTGGMSKTSAMYKSGSMSQRSGMAYRGGAAGMAAMGSGCACGGARSSGGGCARCGGGGVRHFPPARYNEDGSCAPITSISCDTRWRVRECFKVAFCDLLRCLGDQLCDENGRFDETNKPDFGACLETFVCSVVTCLPDAICPPPERSCAAPRPVCAPASDDCNYAVGE